MLTNIIIIIHSVVSSASQLQKLCKINSAWHFIWSLEKVTTSYSINDGITQRKFYLGSAASAFRRWLYFGERRWDWHDRTSIVRCTSSSWCGRDCPTLPTTLSMFLCAVRCRRVGGQLHWGLVVWRLIWFCHLKVSIEWRCASLIGWKIMSTEIWANYLTYINLYVAHFSKVNDCIYLKCAEFDFQWLESRTSRVL